MLISRTRKIDCSNLSSNSTVKTAFKSAIIEKLCNTNVFNDNPNQHMINLMSAVKEVAISTVGYKPKNLNKNFIEDNELKALSDQRHQLITKLKSNSNACDRSKIRKQINHLKNQIKCRLKELNEMKADALAAQIGQTDDCRKMYEAVKTLANMKKTNQVKSSYST